MTSAVEPSVKDLSARLESLNIKLFLEGEELRVRAPKGTMTAQLAASIKQNKEQLMRTLRGAVTIQARDHQEPPPLSFAQQRLWFLDRLETTRGAYNILIALRLKGPLNTQPLTQAFNAVLSRHHILRTRFPMMEGQPVQIIEHHAPITLENQSPQTDLQTFLRTQAQVAFDLERGPLIRLHLLEEAPQTHVLILNLHHILFDGWSSKVLLTELAAAYQAFCKGEPPHLKPLPIQYADYACWQREQFNAGAYQTQLEAWAKRLAQAPPLLELPYDQSRPESQTFAGAAHSFRLKPTDRLHHQTSPFLLYQTAFAALLFRYGAGEDLVYGTPVANRDRLELEGLIGLFTNTVALRLRTTTLSTWHDLLNHVRRVNLDAQADATVPFEQIVNRLRPERNLGYSPIFQVLFTYLIDDEPLRLGNLDVTALDLPEGQAKFDLSLTLTQKRDHIMARIEYNTDLFLPATVSQMASHYQRLVTSLLTQPDASFRTLNLLDPHQADALACWNRGDALSHRKPLPAQVAAVAASKPDRIAVQTASQTLTYRQLQQHIEALAARLAQQGVGPQTAVAVCLDRQPLLPIALLAVLRAGGHYIPIDPQLPSARINQILADSDAALILCQTETANQRPNTAIPRLLIDLQDLTHAAHAPAEPHPQSLAYLIYTSGSTGKPKGVAVTHDALTHFLHAMAQTPGIQEDDALMAVTTVSFDIAALELFLPLTAGARLILPDVDQLRENPTRAIKESGATMVQATPAFWRACLDAEPLPAKLKVLCGGEGLPRDLADALRARGADLWNMYGPTETTVWSAVHHLDTPFHTPYAPIGLPINATQILVLDPYGNPTPPGVPGELHIGGAGLARGYHNQAALTAAAFIPHPFAQTPGQRLYRTGDRVRLMADPQGQPNQIQFLGRIDFQIKLRGFRIEPGEIESQLRAHPQIKAAVVVITKAKPTLVAWLIPQDPQNPPTQDQITNHLSANLPHYMIPDHLTFLDHYPLNTSGKVDRAQLAARPVTPAAVTFVPPQTPTQHTLAHIWTKVLDVASIGLNDNYFQLGGDSIRAIAVAAQARAAGLPLKVRELFRHPTLAKLATHLDQDQNTTPTKPEQSQNHTNNDPIEDQYPLSPIQEGLLFHHAYDTQNGVYIVQISRPLAPHLNLNAFQDAWKTVVQRHPMLRTAFISWRDGQSPVQQVHRNPTLPFHVLDWRPDDPTQTAARLNTFLQQDLTTPIDLETPPAMRFHLIRLPEGPRFIWTFHHILLDGWSMAVIFQEVLTAYQALKDGLTPHLPPAPPYKAHINHLLAKDPHQTRPYWTQLLANLPAPTPLPEALAATQTTASYLQTQTHLPPQLTDQLIHLAQSAGVTPNTLLQGIWAAILARCSGLETVLFGEVDAGRDPEIANIQTMVGLLVNTLPVKITIPNHLSVRQWLPQLFQDQMERRDHAHTPLVQIKAWSAMDSASPLFESLFIFENYPVDRLVSETGLALDIPDQLPTSSDLTSYPLNLFLAMDHGLHLRISHRQDRISTAAANRLLQYFQTLAHAVVANPNLAPGQLPILDQEERTRLLTTWNQTTHPFPADAAIPHLLRANPQPQAVAVIDADTRWTYRQLFQRVDQLTHLLLTSGVGQETLVGVYTRRNRHMIAAMTAVLEAGAAYVPLDPAYPAERIAAIIEDAQLKFILTDSDTRDLLPPTQARLLDADTAVNLPPIQPPRIHPQQTAYLIYTSGSTGRPKGVSITHANAVAFLTWANQAFPGPHTVAASTSICFDLSVFEIFGTLTTGGAMVMLDNILHLNDHPAANQVTLINTVPSALSELLQSRGLPPAVTTVNIAGEPFGPDLIKAVYRQAHVRNLFNLYGPSEDTTYSTYGRMAPNEPPHIGAPIHNTRAYLLNDQLQPVPMGAPGHLHLAGDQMARGYHQRPALTAQRFIPDPFAATPGGRLYVTGDLARYRADGRMDFLGRVDHQVKIRGFRIEPGEIEVHLQSHPDIAEALVLSRETRPGDVNLVAYAAVTTAYRNQSQSAQQEQLDLWRKVWDDTYTHPKEGDPAQDLSGWKDSYTGKDIPAEEMHQWLDHTVQRIRDLDPQHVLELGCGYGLILFRVAPHCQSYTGVDISKAAVDRVNAYLPRHQLQHKVQLQAGPAHDWTAPHPMDLIVINSVAQYFPNAAYLIQVLQKAVAALKPGGRIFLGDLRHHGLQTLFQTGVCAANLPAEARADQLKRAIQEALDAEAELTLDPALFHHLHHQIPRIADLQIHVKPGRAANELTRFRYDVILTLDHAPQRPTAPVKHWRRDDWDLDQLEAQLSAGHTPILSGIPNAHLAADQALARALHQTADNPTITDLRTAQTPEPAVTPAQLYQLARRHHLKLLLTWDPQTTGELLAAFHHGAPPVLPQPAKPKDLSHAANDPLHGKWVRDLLPRLRRHLAQTLPHHMIPAAFVILTRFPRLANGKINRRDLPEPRLLQTAAPIHTAHTTTEKALAAIWCDVLQRPNVDTKTNFFDQGGHSLLLARVQGKIKDRLGIDLPMVDLFRFPNITALARHLSGETDRPQPQAGMRPSTAHDDIAVIGYALRVPGAAHVAQFWDNLCAGVESIQHHTRDQARQLGVPAALADHPNYVGASAKLDHIDQFDAAFFDITPAEAQSMDPQHRLFLELAWHALEHAGCDPARYPGDIGVYAGTGLSVYLLQNPGLIEKVGAFQALIANDKDYVPTRAAYKLNLRGPAVNVQTACSTSLTATHLACQSLRQGECDIALAGGVTVGGRERAGYLFQEGSLYASDGRCRAFDAQADGTVFGDGLGLIVLKRLSDAVKDRDHIHFLIKGSAVNNDGSDRVGFTAPGVHGQQQVVERALSQSGVHPDTIGYVETHGAGTALGDPIEITALTNAWRRHTQRTTDCPIGSVKSNLGHTGFAAGVVGLLKAGLALEHQLIPAGLHCHTVNPRCNFENSPFYVNTSPTPWPRGDQPRRAAVSSFGLGGANAHAILEEAPAAPTAPPHARGVLLYCLAAKTPAALQQKARDLADFLQQYPETAAADITWTLHTGRTPFPHRLAVAAHPDQAAQALQNAGKAQTNTALAAPRTAFLFPGGGVQYPNMGRRLYQTEPVFAQHIDHCAHILEPQLGHDFRQWLYPQPGDETLAAQHLRNIEANLTTIFATSYAAARLWLSLGIQPQIMIGHSLGEYVAACLAGVFSLEDALSLVLIRARRFAQLPKGAMLSINADAATIQPLLSQDLSIAVVNGPQDLIVSGAPTAVTALEHQLNAANIQARRLHIDVAAHSPMLNPILNAFRDDVARFTLNPPKIPFVSNLTGQPITDAQAVNPDYWKQHLRQTVRFADGLQHLLKHADCLLEVGPGRALAAAVKAHPNHTPDHLVLTSLRHPKEDIPDDHFFLTALGRLWTRGAAVDWDAFYAGEQRRRVALPAYPFQRKSYWINAPAAAAPATITSGPTALTPTPTPWPQPDPNPRQFKLSVRTNQDQTLETLLPQGPAAAPTTVIFSGAPPQTQPNDHLIRIADPDDLDALAWFLQTPHQPNQTLIQRPTPTKARARRQLLDALKREILAPAGRRRVSLQGGQRRLYTATPIPENTSAPTLQPDDNVLIVGQPTPNFAALPEALIQTHAVNLYQMEGQTPCHPKTQPIRINQITDDLPITGVFLFEDPVAISRILDQAPAWDPQFIAFLTTSETDAHATAQMQHHAEHLHQTEALPVTALTWPANQPMTTRELPQLLQLLNTGFTSVTVPLQPQAEPSAQIEQVQTETANPPQTKTEKHLAEIWAKALGFDHIGRHDNFFELGGHSLLATRVLAQLKAETGVTLPIAALFKAPTLSALAQTVDAQMPDQTPQAAIQPAPADAPQALSYAQKRQWFFFKFEGDPGTWRAMIALDVEGPLQLDLLQTCLSHMLKRHHILRTLYREEQGEPRPHLLPEPALHLHQDHMAQADDAHIDQWIRDQGRRPFDLANDLPLRVAVLQRGPQSHTLALIMHHIASDAWSMGIFVNELAQLYRAARQNQPNPLPPLPIQYSDFAAWQNQQFSEPQFQAKIQWWEQHLSGAPALLELPTDHPRPAVQTANGDNRPIILSPQLSRHIHQTVAQHAVTPFMLLHAGLALPAARLTQTDDITIGTPASDRPRPELDGLIGFFVNTLVPRVRPQPHLTFAQFLDQVKAVDLDVFNHGDVPFEQVVERLQPQRNLAYSPLFQIMFVYQNAPYRDVDLKDLRFQPRHVNRRAAMFDLTLFLGEHQGQISGHWEYNTDLFLPQTVDRFSRHFQTLLHNALAHPHHKLHQLDLLTPEERRTMLHDWNQTTRPFPAHLCVHQLFQNTAARRAGAVAVIDGDRRITYAQLETAANQTAHRLIQQGVQVGDAVGLIGPRTHHLLIGMLAAFKAGANVLPMDPGVPPARLDLMRRDSNLKLILTGPHIQTPADVPTQALDVELDHLPATPPGVPVSPDHLAYRIYTSGSTGKPKAVVVSHRPLVNLLTALMDAPGFTDDDRLLAVVSISFDIAVMDWLLPVTAGGVLVPATRDQIIDPKLLARRIHQTGVTVLHATPANWRELIPYGPFPNLRLHSAGENLTTQLSAQLLPGGKALWNLYGPTEACIYSAGARIQPGAGGQAETIGGPLPNMRAYILDAHGQPQPVGVPGELCIAGACLAVGYAGQGGLTAERFVPDPFAGLPGERLYRTGDKARYTPDGRIVVLGRLDHQIKLRGFRIEPGEIEAALTRQAAIDQAVVQVHDSPARLSAWVRLTQPNQALDETQLRRDLQTHLPQYMIPEQFIPIDTWPLNTAGKIDRKALLTHHPHRQEPVVQEAEGPTQTALLQIWRDILNRQSVSATDNFFEIGGNSLLLIRVRARIETDLGRDLPMTRLFQHPTIAQLADWLEHQEEAVVDLDAMRSREQKKRRRGRR